MSECSCQTKQISPYRCAVFCFVVLLDAASLTQTQQMMGSGRQSGLGLSNVKPEPSHTHTHTRTRLAHWERARVPIGLGRHGWALETLHR